MNATRHLMATLMIVSSTLAGDILEGSVLALHINVDSTAVFKTPVTYKEKHLQFSQEPKLSKKALRSCSATVSGNILLHAEESFVILGFESFQDKLPDYEYKMFVNDKPVMGNKVLAMPQSKEDKKIVTWSMILDINNAASCAEQVKSVLHPALKKVAIKIANGKKPFGADYVWRKAIFISDEI